MGQTARTTKLLLDLSARDQGGANGHKRRYLEETVALLNAARVFYLEFFLAHPDKLMERVEAISHPTGHVSDRPLPPDHPPPSPPLPTAATTHPPHPPPHSHPPNP